MTSDVTLPTETAERRPELRLSDADRDAVAARLADHHAQGRLTLAEFEDRLAATLTARTGTDLGPVLRDLPAQPGPARRAAPELGSGAAEVGRRSHVAAYVVVITGLWLVWLLTGLGHPWPVWPMLGWGMALLGHHPQVRLCPGSTRAPKAQRIGGCSRALAGTTTGR